MDQNKLGWLLRNLENEARAVLSTDASFLEALQALKQAVDGDPRVKGLIDALQDRGVRLSGSFMPRVRIRLHAGELAVVLPEADTRVPSSGSAIEPEGPSLHPSFLGRLRVAISAAIAESPYRSNVEVIVNEAVQASESFEQLAAVVERAGYNVQIWLDFASYPELRTQRSLRPRRTAETVTPGARQRSTESEYQIPRERSAASDAFPLSGADLLFLKSLQISPE